MSASVDVDSAPPAVPRRRFGRIGSMSLAQRFLVANLAILLGALTGTTPQQALDGLSGAADLKSAVDSTRRSPDQTVEGAARLYGMSANIPIKGVVDAFLKRYLDLLFKL